MSRPALLRPPAALLLALAMVAGLTACGQKGPLYLPPPAAPAPAAEQPAGSEQDKDKEKNTAPASSSTAAPAAQP